MDDSPCYMCNTITGNQYKVTNGETRFICSKQCLNNLLEMKEVFRVIKDISQKYGSLVPLAEVPYILEGFFKPSKTKAYIKELIGRGFIIKKHGSYLQALK